MFRCTSTLAAWEGRTRKMDWDTHGKEQSATFLAQGWSPPHPALTESPGRSGQQGPAVSERAAASQRLDFLLQQLLLVEVRVEALLAHERLVSPALHHFSLLHHENEIGLLHGAETVTHNDERVVALALPQRPKDVALRRRVDGRERVVEDQHSGVADEGSGDRGPLLLPPRQCDAPLAHVRVKAVRKVLHVLYEVRLRGRRPDLFMPGVEVAERDVVTDRVAKQKHVLRHVPHVLAQRPQRDGVNLVPVDGNGAGVRLQEARDHADEGAFAGPSAPDDGEGLVGRKVEVHPPQGRLIFVLVLVPHVAERDAPLQALDRRVGLRPVVDVRLPVHDLLQPQGRRGGPLNHRNHEAERGDRPRHHVDVDDVLGDIPDGDGPLRHELPAHPHHDHRRHAHEQQKGGPPRRLHQREVQVARPVLLAFVVEGLRLRGLSRVGLQHPNARQRLLYATGQRRVLLLQPIAAVVHHAGHEKHRHRQHRQRRECVQRKGGRDDEHDRRRHQHHHEGAGHVHDGRADVAPHLLDVVGRPRNDVPGRVLLVKRGGEPLQVIVEVVAQVVLDVAGGNHDSLPHQKHEEAARPGQGNDHEREQHQRAEEVGVELRLRRRAAVQRVQPHEPGNAVHGLSHHHRHRDLKAGRDHREEKPRHEQVLVLPEEVVEAAKWAHGGRKLCLRDRVCQRGSKRG